MTLKADVKAFMSCSMQLLEASSTDYSSRQLVADWEHAFDRSLWIEYIGFYSG